jgi:hypothetical protein
MSIRGEELNTRLTVSDQASRVLDQVASDMAELEDRPHEIDITADAAQAEGQLSTLDSRLAGLTNEQKQIVLRAQVKNAQAEIGKIDRDLANAFKYDDDEIAIRVNARGDAERKLNDIQADLRALEGEVARVDVEVDDHQIDDAVRKTNELDGRIANVRVNVTGDDFPDAGTGTGAGSGGLGGLGGAGDIALGGALARGGLAGGVAGAGALVAGGILTKAAQDSATWALQAAAVSDLTGDSLETSSRLLAVWADAGFQADELIDLLLQMNSALSEDEDLAKQLGVNMSDGAGLGERFVEVVDALGTQIRDVGERGRVASRVFGDEGVRQTTTIRVAVGDLDQAIRDIPPTRIVDDGDVARAREVTRYLVIAKALKTDLERSAGEGFAVGIGQFLSGENTDPNNILAQIGQRLGSTLRPYADQAVSELGQSLFGGSQPKATSARPLTDAERARLTGDSPHSPAALARDYPFAPSAPTTNNFYTVNPNPRQIDQLERDYIYANGNRVYR